MSLFQQRRITKPVAVTKGGNIARRAIFSPRANTRPIIFNQQQKNNKVGGEIFNDPNYLLDQKRQILTQMVDTYTEIIALRKKLQAIEANNSSKSQSQATNYSISSNGDSQNELVLNDPEKLKFLQNKYDTIEKKVNEFKSYFSEEYKEKLAKERDMQMELIKTYEEQINELKYRKKNTDFVSFSDDLIFRQNEIRKQNETIKMLKEKLQLLSDEENLLMRQFTSLENEEKRSEQCESEIQSLERRLSILKHTRENREMELAKIKKKPGYIKQNQNLPEYYDDNEMEESLRRPQTARPPPRSRPKTSRSPRAVRITDFEKELHDIKENIDLLNKEYEEHESVRTVFNQLAIEYREKTKLLKEERNRRYQLSKDISSDQTTNETKESLSKIENIKEEIRKIVSQRNDILKIETDDLLGSKEQEEEYNPEDDKDNMYFAPENLKPPRMKENPQLLYNMNSTEVSANTSSEYFPISEDNNTDNENGVIIGYKTLIVPPDVEMEQKNTTNEEEIVAA